MTAIEWFLTEFQKQVWFEPNSELDIWINKLIPKAKEYETQQLEQAFFDGTNFETNGFGNNASEYVKQLKNEP